MRMASLLRCYTVFVLLPTWQLARVMREEGSSGEKMLPSESQWSIFLFIIDVDSSGLYKKQGKQTKKSSFKVSASVPDSRFLP